MSEKSLENKLKLFNKMSNKEKIYNIFIKIYNLEDRIKFLEEMLHDQPNYLIDEESRKRTFFNLILKNSTDFDDFKTKYNKYVKLSKKMDQNNINISNENINNIFGFDSSLDIGNKVVTKSNGKKGTILSINESSKNNLDNAKISLKFNNNSTEVRNIKNLKRNTNKKTNI